jgi:hypothetical protein
VLSAEVISYRFTLGICLLLSLTGSGEIERKVMPESEGVVLVLF